MHAGFSRVSITPPLGTRMMGFGTRDMEKGCVGIHDDVFVRALYLSQGNEKALILAYDLCFIGEAETNRFKTLLKDEMGLERRQVLLNASHNHVGPSVGTWYRAPRDEAYVELLEAATLRAAREAKASAQAVTVTAGVGRSSVPMNRRRPEGGTVVMAPNPDGFVYDALPVAVFRSGQNYPVCVLFSVSCHPSMISGWEISAEYPGAAMRRLDEHFGRTCSLFVQGVGGDAKPRRIGEGFDRFQIGTWEMVEEVGDTLAREVLEVISGGLAQVAPALASAIIEVYWAMEQPLARDEYQAIADDETQPPVRRAWARDLVASLDAGQEIPTSVELTLQGIRIGSNLRIVGLEGEAVAGYGPIIADFYGQGITLPLGYCNGEGLYLPTSDQIPEGGYEVYSYWEYGFPAQLKPGFEEILRAGLYSLGL